MTQNTQDQEHRMADSTTPQDSAAMPPASAGSVSEPAAWGVLRVGGGWVSILANKAQAETSRKYFGKMESWVHEIVPLYRHPRVAENATTHTLTDEERECLEWAEEIAGNCEEFGRVEVLRGLLERTKGGER